MLQKYWYIGNNYYLGEGLRQSELKKLTFELDHKCLESQQKRKERGGMYCLLLPLLVVLDPWPGKGGDKDSTMLQGMVSAPAASA